MHNKQKNCVKTNSSLIYLDIFSFIFGLIGISFGVISLLALGKNWDNKILSYNLTVVAVLFDAASFILALIAFIITYRFIKVKKDFLKQNMHLYYFEVNTAIADFISFTIGVIGAILEILSLAALNTNWNNEKFSYSVTVAALLFDTISAVAALIAAILSITMTKYHKLHIH